MDGDVHHAFVLMYRACGSLNVWYIVFGGDAVSGGGFASRGSRRCGDVVVW